MKGHLYIAAKHIAVFAFVLTGLWLLLVFASLIPNKAIESNMKKSALSYKEQEAFEFTSSDRLSSVADHYADSIWLNVAWNLGEKNPLRSSIQTQYYDGEELGVNAGLYYSVTENIEPNKDYSRYWHGTAAFIRLFHLFTDVDGIKAIGFAVFLALVGVSVFILARRKHIDLAILFVLSLVAVHIWNIRLSLEYQPAFIVAFAMLPLYLIWERRGDGALTLLSVASGTAVAFFDFLTTETVAILLPLVLVIGVRSKEGRLSDKKQSTILALKCLLFWLCAYGAAFLTKWIIASAVTGTDVFATALSSVSERIGVKTEVSSDEPGGVFSSVLANLTTLFGGTARIQMPLVIVGVLLSGMVLLSIWYLFKRKEKNPLAATLMLSLGAMVFVRYLILGNHSYLHAFFTYRALVTPIFAFLAAMWLNMCPPWEKRRRK